MRIEEEIVALTWIPSEAVRGAMKLPFEVGISHYDETPPDRVGPGDLDALRDADRFRFANRLRAWAEFDDGGQPVAAGYSGGEFIGATTLHAGARAAHTFEAFAMPLVQHPPVLTNGQAVFVQTAGGRTGVPAPRRVNHPPFVQWRAPLAWTTLALTVTADGSTSFELSGASPFPRHWVYGPDGMLSLKSGVTDFKDWLRHSFGGHTPWGDEDTPALVTAAESALERALAERIMKAGEKPDIRKVKEGTTLVREGDPGTELFLLLDGVVRVDVGGEPVAEMGPGAIFGERALLEGGRRTSTLVATTRCRLAVARADQLDTAALAGVAEGHRREDQRREDQRA